MFDEGAFYYDKALCCLKWISVIEVRTCIQLVRYCMQTGKRLYMYQLFSVAEAINCMAVYTPVFTAAPFHIYRLHRMTTSKTTSAMSMNLSLPTLSWSLTVSHKQDNSTTASGSIDDSIYTLCHTVVNVFIHIGKHSLSVNDSTYLPLSRYEHYNI